MHDLLRDRSHSLKADCEQCFGLCCVALYFSAAEGFPTDKEAGQPCPNLQADFRCQVHQSLRAMGLKGCTAFDCFGAGQKVAQVTYGGLDWRATAVSAPHMFESFLVMRQLHEMLWYLSEALTLKVTHTIHGELKSILGETIRLTELTPEGLLSVDVVAHRAGVNALLRRTSELVRAQAKCGQKAKAGRQKSLGRGADLIAADLRRTNLRGADLRGAYLIAANLRGVDFTGADVIGADLRDADLRGADLSKSIFLTQAQINAAKGDASTKLPPSLTRPQHWVETT